MKIVSKPIGMVAIFSPGENPRPYKFSYGSKEIKVDNILNTTKTKIAGVEAIVYDCQSTVKNKVIRYELRYTVRNCQWVLYKI